MEIVHKTFQDRNILFQRTMGNEIYCLKLYGTLRIFSFGENVKKGKNCHFTIKGVYNTNCMIFLQVSTTLLLKKKKSEIIFPFLSIPSPLLSCSPIHQKKFHSFK